MQKVAKASLISCGCLYRIDLNDVFWWRQLYAGCQM